MVKRYCDKCGQQIDDGVHSWYVIELHGTDGELRHKEVCEECYATACEDGYVPKVAEQTEPQTCRNCKWSQTVCRLGDNPPCHSYEPKTEPQGIVLPRKGCHRPIELPCHSEQGDGYCANCIYWHEDFEGVAYGKPQTERSE